MPVHLEPAPELFHAHQIPLYGCMYHAAYAVIGDETLLDHVGDMSTGAWLARLAARGHAVQAIYSTYFLAAAAPLSAGGWEHLRSLASLNAVQALPALVTVESERVQGYHLIALQIPHRSRDIVLVSDSVRPAIQRLTWAEFLHSRYARAFEVAQLISLDPDAWPHVAPNPIPRMPLQETP